MTCILLTGASRGIGAAAKRAQAAGAKGAESSKLLVWIEHYLHRRNPYRAKHLVGQPEREAIL